MSDSKNTLKSISWLDLCPWLILSKSFGIAIRPSILMVAFAGVLLTPLGWYASEKVFLNEELIEGRREEFNEPDLLQMSGSLDENQTETDEGDSDKKEKRPVPPVEKPDFWSIKDQSSPLTWVPCKSMGIHPAAYQHAKHAIQRLAVPLFLYRDDMDVGDLVFVWFNDLPNCDYTLHSR